MKNKNQNRSYINITSDSIAMGADIGYVENLFESSLQTVVASLTESDGDRCKISSFRVRVSMTCDGGNDIFCLQPVVIQTAGTFTDSVAQPGREVSKLIAAAISDVFGYDLLGNLRFSKVMPTGDGTQAALVTIIETTFNLPPKILNILNKESESERLQDLFVGIVGLGLANQTFYIKIGYEIKFIKDQQKVVIR